MAKDKEKDEEKSPEEGGKKKKGGALKLIIIVLVLLIVLGGGGFFAFKMFLAPKDKTAEQQAPQQAETNPAAEGQVGILYPLDTFIVNLSDNDGSRYLKVTMSLELDNTEKLKEDLDTRVPQLRDAILTILAAKRYEEVSSAQGKLILKQEILRRINSLLPKGQITNVYFTEFVAQ